VLSVLAAGALVTGCGDDDDFENEPRPPVPIQLTGVITDERVTVSPRTIAPGPIVLIISNQTDRPHGLTLQGGEGERRVNEEVDEVAPGDTGTLQATLSENSYEVKANSKGAVEPEDVIRPATIRIDEKPAEECKRLEEQGRSDPLCRGSSSDELLLP
jgi:hypothetical protein